MTTSVSQIYQRLFMNMEIHVKAKRQTVAFIRHRSNYMSISGKISYEKNFGRLILKCSIQDKAMR